MPGILLTSTECLLVNNENFCCPKHNRLVTFFLLVLGNPDLLQVGVTAVGVGAALLRETEGHDLLEEDVGDADGQRHQVDLEVVLHRDATNRGFFSENGNIVKNKLTTLGSNPSQR